MTSAGQEAALASLDETAEIARRRSVNKESMALLVGVLREHGFEPGRTGRRELPVRPRG